jgi:acyl dehydratase
MQKKLTTYDDLMCGQCAEFTKTITQADLSHFIAITADANPLHVDAGFAARTFFKKPIAHGLLSASLFSHVVGMILPGTGAIYRSQCLDFHRPVYVGDTLTASLEITRIDADNELIEMQGNITNQHGDTVISGLAKASLLRSLKEDHDGGN